jgi:hypothetical protein
MFTVSLAMKFHIPNFDFVLVIFVKLKIELQF